jgi:hypothetical protein
VVSPVRFRPSPLSLSPYLPGDEYLATGGERRDPRRDVDGCSKVVAAPLDGRAMVGADSDRWGVVAAHCAARDPQGEANCVGGVGHSEHERVAGRLHVLAVDAWELRLNGIRELLDQLDGLLVPIAPP